MKRLFGRKTEEDHDFWMSYTDLMSGFLIVFIITSLIFHSDYTNLRREISQQRQLRNLITEYEDILISNDEIKVEFDNQRGSIILTHQDDDRYLFQSGRAQMEPELKRFLNLNGKKMIEKTIALWDANDFTNIEMRIEGHTDPSWDGTRGADYGYIRNLELSSARANQVYTYMLENLGLSRDQREFVKKNMISIGYSYSRRVANDDIDNLSLDPSSRRIEFRIISK